MARARTPLAALLGLLAATLVAGYAHSDPITSTWFGGEGAWHLPTNWDNLQVPNNNGVLYNAVVNSGRVVAYSDVEIEGFELRGTLAFDPDRVTQEKVFTPTSTHTSGATKGGTFKANGPITLEGCSLQTWSGGGSGLGIDLSAATSYTSQNADAVFEAFLAEIDLSGLESLEGDNTLHIRAYYGGRIHLQGATSFQIPDSEILADGDAIPISDRQARVDLSGLETFAPSYSNIKALHRGVVDLGGLTEMVGHIRVEADGTHSTVHLSQLATFEGYRHWESYLWIHDQGTIETDSLTTLNRVGLMIGEGSIDTAEITEYTEGCATVDGVEPDFSGMTDITGSGFVVTGGGRVSVPNAASTYIGTGLHNMYFQADGGGSQLHLASLETVDATGNSNALYIRALEGGYVELSGINEFLGRVRVEADGPDSTVDLHQLTTFQGSRQWESDLWVHDQGTIETDSLTTLNRVGLTIGEGSIDTDQITEYTEGCATVEGVELDFSGMTDITGSSFVVNAGGRVSVPNAPSTYTGTNLHNMYFQADGGGSQLDLTTLETVDAASGSNRILYIRAFNGGLVDLRGVTELLGRVRVEADGPDSTVDLSQLARFQGYRHWESRLKVHGQGTITLGPSTLAIDNAGVIVEPDSTLNGGGLRVESGGPVVLTGDLNLTGTVDVPGTFNLANRMLAVEGPSLLTVDGNVQMDGSSQYSPGLGGQPSDLVAVTGNAEIGGTLTIHASSALTDAGGSPVWGDTRRTVLTAAGPGGVTGTFTSDQTPYFAVPNEGDCLGYGMWFGNAGGVDILYVGNGKLVTAVEVAVFQAKAGDCNGDRSISFADFNDLANNYTGALDPGVGGKEWRQGDYNGDADVDFGDFNDLANNYTGAGVEYGPGTPAGDTPAGDAKAASGEASLIVYLANTTDADGVSHAAGDVVLSVDGGLGESGMRINGYEVYSAGGLLIPDAGGAPYPLVGGAYMEESSAVIVAVSGLTSPLRVSGDQDWTLGWRYDVQAKAAADLEFCYGTSGGVISGNVLYVVPEPGSLLLLACGALGLLLAKMQRRATESPAKG